MKKRQVKKWLALSLVCSLSCGIMVQADTLKENDENA